MERGHASSEGYGVRSGDERRPGALVKCGFQVVLTLTTTPFNLPNLECRDSTL